ncbi:GNAT family N-acetyltransferase [Nocardia xishanensis]|uniref:GNAT family N-acetyltransferase n=1 Tax=Nocardia xishanensis TaxID=238964 RepID=UPI0034312C39
MNHTGSPYVLARELTDVPDEVRSGPAPVTPTIAAPYNFRLADPDSDDPELLAEWMSRPHLLETWEQAWPAERRRADWRAQLAGTYSRPYILGFDFSAIDHPELGVRDVAYVELYRPAKDEIARFYEAEPHDMAIHIATADLNVVGRGVMSTLLSHLFTAIFTADPRCRRIMGDPDHRNESLLRAARKTGCQDLGVFDVRPGRRIALVTRTRTPEDVPAIRQ